MEHVDVIAVIGNCAPERRSFAGGLAKRRSRSLIVADRLAAHPDPGLEAVAIAPWIRSRTGVVVEFPAHASTIELIGAFTDPAASTRLSEVVCVVDATHLLDDLIDDEFIATRRDPEGRVIELTARALLAVRQLEFASTIVLVGWEALDTPELATLMALVSSLSPQARLRLHTGDDDTVGLATTPYARESDRPGWVALLNGDADPCMTDARVSGFRYEQLRPLHPQRLKTLFDTRIEAGEFGTLIRSAGDCRFATRPGILLHWEHVGQTISLLEQDIDPSHEEALELPLGQELACIGLDLDHDGLRAALDETALTDDELAAGPEAWAAYPDPFPSWDPATEDITDH